ncbi:MAG: DNA-3-methyladenine glycosylase I [archaeon]
MKRCSWCSGDELYCKYHDEEWGVAVHSDRKLFEFLVLEGAQAGLSWITILKKRENYRRAFCDWDYNLVAGFEDEDIERLMRDEGIVRNRLKINSAVNNAKRFLEVRKEFGSFSNYLWKFVDGNVVVENGLTRSDLSDEISKDLKRRGFSFVGSTIVYAFLQAVGVVWGHEVGCFCEERDNGEKNGNK